MLTLDGIRVERPGFQLTANLTVPAGATVAVIGPSGAGKSTLLEVIGGFTAPAAGRVLWTDRDLTPMPPGARPVSTLFQDNNLFPHLTVAQNVGLGLRPDLRLDDGQKDQVENGLLRVGLTGLGRRKPAALSGGQRSRVAIARMMLRRNPVMLLDEPFAALGPALKAEMLSLVRQVQAEIGATLLMVTHDPDDARRLAGQTILVADGLARPPVPTDKLLDNPPPELRAYLGK